ncbi:MAG: ribosome biogenesis GTP-binding protein YihA/YsxC [Oscillospiraceae bacterium]|nr:ribosome biogenesis GTP-binding protein YihA/YsxC [Oscillospiraceae bacterium]
MINWNKAEITASYGKFPQIPLAFPLDPVESGNAVTATTSPSAAIGGERNHGTCFHDYKTCNKRVEIAFSGRSNVGKSSLINKLLNRKALARVSSTPGKTVTINFYTVDNIFIVDLPGYGYAKAAKTEKARFGELTERYLTAGRTSLLIQLIDFRHPPTADDLMMLQFLKNGAIPFVIALTKADKLKKKQRAERRAALVGELEFLRQSDIPVIEFSSETGEGVLELRGEIEKVVQNFTA